MLSSFFYSLFGRHDNTYSDRKLIFGKDYKEMNSPRKANEINYFVLHF